MRLFLKLAALLAVGLSLAGCETTGSPIAMVWTNGTPPALQHRPLPGDPLPMMDANLKDPAGAVGPIYAYEPIPAQRALYLARLKKAVDWLRNGTNPCLPTAGEVTWARRSGTTLPRRALLVVWHLPGNNRPMEPLIGCWDMETSYFDVVEGRDSYDGYGTFEYDNNNPKRWRLVLLATGMAQYRQVSRTYNDWGRDRDRARFQPGYCVGPTHVGGLATPAGTNQAMPGCTWPSS